MKQQYLRIVLVLLALAAVLGAACDGTEPTAAETGPPASSTAVASPTASAGSTPTAVDAVPAISTHALTPTDTPDPVLTILADYHPKLQEAVLHPAPNTAGDKAFLADSELSESELRALERAQSVFGIPAFYNAWELDTLEANEVQAALYMLSFYDPYTVVNDITADPADPEAEGARMTRALDDFGVYPGSCVYCKGQRYGDPRKDWWGLDPNPTFHRTKLLNLVHHATVQADMLSPCDLNDFSEEELLALGVMVPAHGGRLLYSRGMVSFTHSIRLTNELLNSASRGAAVHGESREWIANAVGVLVQPGEILSPFTHAIRATGGPPTARGMELCLKAVEGIVDWDSKRYIHFTGAWNSVSPIIEYIFPESPHVPPVWATFLLYESGGQDKGERLAAQFRALNMPAVKDGAGIYLNENAERWAITFGRDGIFLPAFNLYIHRNIGFGATEMETDIKRMIHNGTIPDHCSLQRARESFPHGIGWVEYVCDKEARAFGDPPEGTFATISAGTGHVCALITDGTPVCWGSESNGKSSPPAGAKFTTISAGSDHTCALLADGTPVCWGADLRGQSSPPAGEKFTDISAGFGYTCALRQDGTPSCWGYDIFQRLDHPKLRKEIFYSSRFREIDAGEIGVACGLLANREMMRCNREHRGLSIQIGQDAHSISSGIGAVCALRRDGSAVCWGSDDLTPPAGEKFTDISVGSRQLACGLRTDGTAVCWGPWASLPPPAGAKFIDISVPSARSADSGYGYVCALSENGAASCWRH